MLAPCLRLPYEAQAQAWLLSRSSLITTANQDRELQNDHYQLRDLQKNASTDRISYLSVVRHSDEHRDS
jgi:hypothetical protein